MTTPNIGSGVTERNKPVSRAPSVVYRREQSLSRGSTITTPIFDLGADGWPLNDAELAGLGGLSVVRIPSPYMRVVITSSIGAGATNPGGLLNILEISDAGGFGLPFTYYIQPRRSSATAMQGCNVYRYTMVGRRCVFQLQNFPLGKVLGLAQTYRLEIVSEG